MIGQVLKMEDQSEDEEPAKKKKKTQKKWSGKMNNKIQKWSGKITKWHTNRQIWINRQIHKYYLL
jgi:hypothetical protein